MSLSKGEHLKLYEGDLIDSRFRVLRELGAGNFSKVYCCHDITRQREVKRALVAVKIVKREYMEDAYFERDMLDVFRRKRAEGPMVCRMMEFFEWRKCPVIVMSIHGPSLRTRRLGFKNGVVTRTKLVQLAYSLLTTLRYVHFDCQMVHTDMKPDNILLADLDAPKHSLGSQWVVCDFGSASLWRMDHLDADLITTRPYRAPEVVLGNQWFYAADMWSMGCILFEVATGQRLFDVRDDVTHLQLMEKRLGPLPDLFTRNAKHSAKYFTSSGSFIAESESIRAGKVSMRKLKDVFSDDPELYELISAMLIYDPMKRLTAKEGLQHSIFDGIHLLSKKTDAIDNNGHNLNGNSIAFSPSVLHSHIEGKLGTGSKHLEILSGVGGKIVTRRGSSVPAISIDNNTSLNPHPPNRLGLKFVGKAPRVGGTTSRAFIFQKARPQDSSVVNVEPPRCPTPERGEKTSPDNSHPSGSFASSHGNDQTHKMRRFPVVYASPIDMSTENETLVEGISKLCEKSVFASSSNTSEGDSLVRNPPGPFPIVIPTPEKVLSSADCFSEYTNPHRERDQPSLKVSDISQSEKSLGASQVDDTTGAGSPLGPLTHVINMNGLVLPTECESEVNVGNVLRPFPSHPLSCFSATHNSLDLKAAKGGSDWKDSTRKSGLHALATREMKGGCNSLTLHPAHTNVSELSWLSNSILRPSTSSLPPTHAPTAGKQSLPFNLADVISSPKTAQTGNLLKEGNVRVRVFPNGAQGAVMPRVIIKKSFEGTATNSTQHQLPSPTVRNVVQQGRSGAMNSLAGLPRAGSSQSMSLRASTIKVRRRSDTHVNVLKTVNTVRSKTNYPNSQEISFQKSNYPLKNGSTVAGRGVLVDMGTISSEAPSMFAPKLTASTGVVSTQISSFNSVNPTVLEVPQKRRPSVDIRPTHSQLIQRNVVSSGKPGVCVKNPPGQEYLNQSDVSRAMQSNGGADDDTFVSGVTAGMDGNATQHVGALMSTVEDASCEMRAPHMTRHFPTVQAPE
ncbi:protein kinase [Trypanosoma cruzi Dm28c]|uniref:Protein kinase n=2 Tax=Trypanosoma cruzi TaxID=5693 RepID=V5BIN3_TRYCR|nr:protein kinase [Trypanosoma cruzi Dm28c]PBJ79404.1 protein kinase [Trypanosoma cruzi cruzi]PWU99466.1 putative protein kinase [Trypanosoma cruzi]